MRPTHVANFEPILIMELFQLATLVYLEKASGNTLCPAEQTRIRIDRAFEIFPQLRSCERLLPLFLLGSEARTDDERIVVLDLLARSEQSLLYKCTRLLIEAVWTQDDLAERELVYVEKLGAVISICDVMMTFV